MGHHVQARRRLRSAAFAVNPSGFFKGQVRNVNLVGIPGVADVFRSRTGR